MTQIFLRFGTSLEMVSTIGNKILYVCPWIRIQIVTKEKKWRKIKSIIGDKKLGTSPDPTDQCLLMSYETDQVFLVLNKCMMITEFCVIQMYITKLSDQLSTLLGKCHRVLNWSEIQVISSVMPSATGKYPNATITKTVTLTVFAYIIHWSSDILIVLYNYFFSSWKVFLQI